MKYALCLIALFTLTNTTTFAKKFDGQVVMKSGDTIKCKLLFSGLHVYKWRNEIISRKKLRVEVGDDKLTLAPENILNYSIQFNDSWQTYWSINTINNGYMFMRKIVDGSISMYNCVTYDHFNYQYYRHYFYRKMGDDSYLYFRLGTIGVKKRVLNYFYGCIEIVNKIKSKEYKVANPIHLELIARMYNDNCGH